MTKHQTENVRRSWRGLWQRLRSATCIFVRFRWIFLSAVCTVAGRGWNRAEGDWFRGFPKQVNSGILEETPQGLEWMRETEGHCCDRCHLGVGEGVGGRQRIHFGAC